MKYVVIDDSTGNGIASFDTAREAAMYQYSEKVYMTTSVIEIA